MEELSGPLKALSLSELFKKRKTSKVLADIHAPLEPQNLKVDVVDFLLEAAHWAPFHKPAHESYLQGELNSIVPWRFHMLDAANCRALLETLKEWSQHDSSWLKGKVPSMLAAASAMFQVAWLPNPSKTQSTGAFEATVQNMEIIAAASTAIQNLLLAASAQGLPNYWASGSNLLREEVFDYLCIDKREVVLGAIFLFPADTSGLAVHEGAWRHKRGDIKDWARVVNLSDNVKH